MSLLIVTLSALSKIYNPQIIGFRLLKNERSVVLMTEVTVQKFQEEVSGRRHVFGGLTMEDPKRLR